MFISRFIHRLIKSHREMKALNLVMSHKNEIHINSKDVVLTRNTVLGRNPNFNGLKIRGHGKVTIGDNFHSGENCLIITDFHNYQGEALPYDDTVIIKDVTIGDNVWIGVNVIILGGVTIGEGAIIQAGAVVIKDIPDLGIAGGNPATVFKYRNAGHYNKLKEEGKFH